MFQSHWLQIKVPATDSLTQTPSKTCISPDSSNPLFSGWPPQLASSYRRDKRGAPHTHTHPQLQRPPGDGIEQVGLYKATPLSRAPVPPSPGPCSLFLRPLQGTHTLPFPPTNLTPVLAKLGLYFLNFWNTAELLGIEKNERKKKKGIGCLGPLKFSS